ncbi:uncharacterized protein BDZ99DRAFT_556199 [Mytilinidion resinicola]|uniref:Uncharacterized protein n=1 Tax=Mytilinidion resinicola TaxID=574789 RepID=A0A6A6YWZ2_9PEZI|nr:uncharacterized protein BDZ99DRAFT_556199 [Mytilinidion resinicola]KAF2813039.1 hypothetical protein BDZ99DRAFT_556199 [Mytilinidion resinicola]
MANFVSYVAPTSLENARAIIPNDYEPDLFNDMGFVLRAKADSGEDIHLWMFMYRQRGEEVIINNEVCQTLLVCPTYTPAEKESMHDTPFINKGQNIDDYHPLNTLTFTDTPTTATWTLAGRVFSSRANHWTVSGSHAGVSVQLEWTQRGDALYNGGPFADLHSDAGHSAFIVHAHVTGTVTAGGRTLVVSAGNGHGIHERICMAGHVPARLQYMLERGMNWLNGYGAAMSWYIKTASRGRSATMMLNVYGETLAVVGGEWAGVEEVGFWLDPKTNQVNPRKWRVWAVVEGKGRLEAVVTAYGRAYYTWVRQGGVVLVNQFVADAVCTWTREDGTRVVEEQMAMNEYMRTLYVQPTS